MSATYFARTIFTMTCSTLYSTFTIYILLYSFTCPYNRKFVDLQKKEAAARLSRRLEWINIEQRVEEEKQLMQVYVLRQYSLEILTIDNDPI